MSAEADATFCGLVMSRSFDVASLQRGFEVEAPRQSRDTARQSSGRDTRRSVAGLFPSEREIAHRLSQDPSGWKARAVVLEREGLPRICPVMGGRYWPAVVAFFNRRYGLGSLSPSCVDGMENLDVL